MQIKDRNFILSYESFTPKNELLANIKYLFFSKNFNHCRFPARQQWLEKQLDLPISTHSDCPEIAEFDARAPFDKLELVFADAAIETPASILGHSFLKFSGLKNNVLIEHSISFYTSTEGTSTPKLLWESMVTGKQGIFALTPYDSEEKKYSTTEQRNLWLYEIKIDAFEKSLIKNHLFELKNAELKYFFHTYNCATVLQNILSLAGQIDAPASFWSTPKNIAQNLSKTQWLKSTQVTLSDAWLVNNSLLANAEIELIHQWLVNPASERVITKKFEATSHFLQTMSAANVLLKNMSKINSQRYEENLLFIDNLGGENTSFASNQLTKHLTNPIDTYLDSYVSAGFNKKAGVFEKTVTFSPVGHTLIGNKNAALNETELSLLQPTLSYSDAKLSLSQLKIYSMTALVPWNKISNHHSTKINLSYDLLDEHLTTKKGLNAYAQLGYTRAFTHQLKAYFLAGLGLSLSATQKTVFNKIDLGLLWSISENAKVKITNYTLIDANKRNNVLLLDASLYLNNKDTLSLNYQKNMMHNKKVASASITFIRAF